MKKIYQVLAGAGVFCLLLAAGTPLASAQVRQWSPRTAEAIRQEIEKNTTNGVNGYTVQWGDTLYAISQATDVSIEQLMEFNSFDNARLIDVGTTIYFNQEDQSVALESNQETNSDYVMESSEETVENSNVSDATQSGFEYELLDGHTTTPYTQEPSEEIVLPTPVVPEPVVQEVVEQVSSTTSPKLYALRQFMFDGIIYWNGLKFTYYSQQVLPGGGLRIPGRHVNADGYVADGDGYIVLANNAPLGTIIDTPFGYKGKVYDRGTVGNHFDVYIR